MLDLLCEDLYRKPKKPYVEMTEANGKPDSLASEEAWTKHLIRNESIITDLFHGQYKSTLVCSICKKISVTFDPFMTLSLPIPGKKEKYTFFFVPYHIGRSNYTNLKGEAMLTETDSIREFRMQIAKKYNLNPGGFVISCVQDNNIKKMLDQNSRMEDTTGSGVMLLYEIPQELNPKLVSAETSSKSDSNYGIEEQMWTKVVVYMN